MRVNKAVACATALAAALITAGPALAQEQSQPAPLRKPAAGAAAASAKTLGSAVYWYDGTQRRQWHVDAAYVADFAAAKAAGTPRAPLKRSLGGEKALETLSSGQSAVFRDEAGNAGALPGGMIVKLKTEQIARARALLADAGLAPVRALDADGSVWLVDSPAGVESLTRANQLHESGRFESVSPNWWRERVRK